MKIKVKGVVVLVAVMMTLSSCWREDEPFVLPPAKPGVVQKQITLGPNYDKIVYFNLKENTYVIRQLGDWDLSFACAPGEKQIRINGGKGIGVFNTGIKDFSQPFTIQTGHVFTKVDKTNGDKDSTAIGRWWNSTNVSDSNLYIIGPSPLAPIDQTAYFRLQILNEDATGFTIQVGKKDDPTTFKQLFIPKDSKHNYTYLTLGTNEIKTDFEPEKDTWDIVFTQYAGLVFSTGDNKFLEYELRGALINPNGALAVMEQNKKFEDIDLTYAMTLKFSDASDVIGYEWKTFDQATNRYTVDPTRTYIIKAPTSGFYYKLRFIDFYDQAGQKGSPTFEYQRL